MSGGRVATSKASGISRPPLSSQFLFFKLLLRKIWKKFLIAIYQRLALGSAPILDLLLSIISISNSFVLFTINKFDWQSS